MRTLHILLLISEPIVTSLLAYWAWQHDRGVLGKWFVTNCVVMTGWGFTVLLQMLVEPLLLKVMLYQLKYVFQWATAVGWFVFSIHYTQNEKWMTHRLRFAISAIFITAVLLSVTNGTSGVLWTEFWIAESPFPHLMMERTPFFWGYLAVGHFFVLGTSIMMLARMNAVGRASRQPLLFGVAVLIVFIFDGITRFQLGLVENFDYTILSLSLYSGVIAHLIFSEGLLKVDPVKRTDVMEAVQDGIVAINEERLIVDYNSHAVSIFPDLEGSIGKPIDEIAPALIDETSANRLFVDEMSRNTEDGIKAFRVVSKRLGSGHGWALTIRDVTDIQQYAQDLEQQTEQLDDFASVVAHDIRNPLAVAETYMRDLQRDVEDDRIQTSIDAVHRIDSIIDDALTLAREGQALDERDWFNMGDIVEDAWGMCDTPHANLDVRMPESTRIHTDPNRLQTVFENLIRNSIEHGGESVTIRVGLLEDDDGFYFEDDGDGIPEEKRDSVFDKGMTTDQDGTGFGLAIVQSVVDAHGWSISATEGVDGGARFEVRDIDALAKSGEEIATAD